MLKLSDLSIIKHYVDLHFFSRAIGNPLWNQLLVAGYRGDAPFLGYVDLIGTAYEENFIATGIRTSHTLMF